MAINRDVIDRASFPKTGREFLLALRTFSIQIYLRGVELRGNGFPKFIVGPPVITDGVSPNLINIWCFEDDVKNAYVIGGVAGPTQNPRTDWRLFDNILKTLEIPDRFEKMVELLNDAVVIFIENRPDLFSGDREN
jgi:hypothetical protein